MSSGTRPHDFPRTVDVLDESVQRIDALGQALFQEPPFRRRHDARDDIEGDQALLRFGFPVNGEGDADPTEDQFGLAPPVVEDVRRHIGEPAREFAIGRAHAAVLSLHLIEGGNHSRAPTDSRLSNACSDLTFVAFHSSPLQASGQAKVLRKR
jgi:hypothetical protein